MLKRTIFLSLFWILLSIYSYAQNVNVEPSKGVDKVVLDSIYSQKLNSTYFSDSLNRIRVFSWSIDTYTNIPTRIPIDTNQRNIQKNYPFYEKDNVGAIFLGNIGGAAINIDYFKIKPKTSFLFQNSYQDFIGIPENVTFYNTKSPYTNVRYATAGGRAIAEEIFGLTLAQNVTPALSFGVNYNRWGTKGLYKNQRSKTKDFSGYVSYLGKKYTAYAGYIFNLEDVNENGGVLRDSDILDTTIDARYIDVRLRNANNTLKNNTFFVSQTYGIPLSSSVAYTENGIYSGPELLFGMYNKYATYYRVYKDNGQDTSIYNYYKNFYINYQFTNDSTHLREFDNRIYIQLRPFTTNSIVNLFGGGIGYQHLNYYMFTLNDYLFGSNGDKQYSIYGYAYASGKFRKYINWNAFGKLSLAGYNAGDIDANGSISFSVYPWNKEVKLVGDIDFTSQTPNFFLNNYFSNHFVWNNSFNRTVETRIAVKLQIPSIDLNAGVRQAIIDGYTYFGDDALPKQNNGAVSVTSAYLQKDFAIGHLHLDGQILFQKSSNEEILPLPAFAANASLYYQFNIVKNVLKSQVGFDFIYNSSYYAYAYNPATGQFHTQNDKKLGNYPWVDVFANFKWKRVALFVKGRNVAKGLGGNYDYFSALHYPRVPFQLQYGLSWTFYD